MARGVRPLAALASLSILAWALSECAPLQGADVQAGKLTPVDVELVLAVDISYSM